MNLPADAREVVSDLGTKLSSTLGENLVSLAIYGSAVRGNFVSGKSDLNLLLVLKASTPEAHAAIADQLSGPIRIEPLIVAVGSLERTMKAFPSKFLSIQRHYEVIHGDDPFRSVGEDLRLNRFLVEESLRNIRLRLVYNYIKLKNDPKRYQAYLLDVLPSFFTVISDVLRASAQEVPQAFEERLPVFEKTFAVNAGILRRLLDIRDRPTALSAKETLPIHADLCRFFDEVLTWVEGKWPIP